MLNIDELKNQITWLNVSGSREVTRLPSHFVPVVTASDPGTFMSTAFWETGGFGDAKFINMLRIYIENNYAGRYFIRYNSSGTPTALSSSYALIVAFEDPAEASFFSLQSEFIFANITKKINARKK